MQDNNGLIAAGRPVTIQHIADELGIHKSTVSYALAGKGRISASLRARILARAEELGYEPDPLAQRLANRAKSKVVCLCTGAFDPGRATEKIALIQAALTGRGLEVPIYTPAKATQDQGASQAALLRQLRRQRPQAIICASFAFHAAAFRELEQYQHEGGIVVSYDIPVPLACDQVIYDREDNAYQGAHYLIERGHRRIGIGMSRMAKPLADPINLMQRLRYQGFERVMTEFGVPKRNEWFFQNSTFERGGAEMARHFLELKERPTGLCIVNDYVALSFMVEVIRAGVRIPKDVSIVGHDNLPIAAYCPVPLTSVAQPAEEIVDTVVALMMERIAGSTRPPRTITIKGRLVERQSVMALN
ncbi:MAG: LacI family DNA-binding transcriptional regulator [Abitibacteriaceae bacterium]|nr:LacI family DNA-binding transcriptional regulator [Abditibacteriaceae bacterium]MBV9868167.1 LacI family DNA-binding transcriptional regulator [Abditibacteriaceae bacterium]